MAELRGVSATPEVKEEWSRAYRIFAGVNIGAGVDKKEERTRRLNVVMVKLNLTRKQAKRRVRNYEQWQRNIQKGAVKP